MAAPVSVILTTYNRALLLPRSIESVLAQTYRHFELIVIDDGSGDDTDGAVAQFADARIRYVKLPANRGLPAARNEALSRTRGAFYAFQDSDDEWHPEKLERQMRAFDANPRAGVVYCDMIRIMHGGQRLYFRSPDIERGRLINPATRYWQSYMLAMQPALVRRECLDGARFDERLAMFEDLDLYLRLARRCDFVHLREPLVHYHQTFGMTSVRRNELRGRRQLLQKYAKALLASDPLFLLKESFDIALRRSLMPVVNQHLTPL
jgi:glycosyltransferase involved in cell wall biosynthesis